MMGASAVLKLQKVGFSAEQVEALADFMDTQVASKADVEGVEHRLGARLQEFRSESKADVEGVEHRLGARLQEVKTELEAVEHRFGARLQEFRSEAKADVEGVEHRLESRILESKNDLLKTIIAVMVVNSAVILAAMFGLAKLLGH
jgi:hypothetical protein